MPRQIPQHILKELDQLRKENNILKLENQVLRDDYTTLRARSIEMVTECRQLMINLKSMMLEP